MIGQLTDSYIDWLDDCLDWLIYRIEKYSDRYIYT